MTRDEFLNSNIYLGKIVFIDSTTNQMWNEELLSTNSKKARALLKKFPQGGTFSKQFIVKFVVKGNSQEFDLGLPSEESK